MKQTSQIVNALREEKRKSDRKSFNHALLFVFGFGPLLFWVLRELFGAGVR